MSTTESTEQLLSLPGGRTLAYEESGPPSSSTIVIWFHGVFGVGRASNPSPVLVSKGVRFVTPTVPGWGNSSPVPNPRSFAACLAADITALFRHLHPGEENLRIYIAGGSLGTTYAQMIYGAPYDIFPYGHYIQGLLLAGPLSPFNYHKDYARSMTMSNYLMIGPPAVHIPFKILPRITKLVMGSKLKTIEAAEAFLQSTIFDPMDLEEREEFRKWRELKGKAEGEFEREMAGNMVCSVAKTWRGFMEIPDFLHSDWGFNPATLDEEHAKPILVVSTKGDTMTPVAMAEWIASTYKNTRLKILDGGHLASLYSFDDIWAEFLEHEHEVH